VALGPVFERELLVTARRRRFYALRAGLGLALLAVIATTVRSTPLPPDAGVMAGIQLAQALFQNLLLAQGLAVVFLTPALVAGAIAGEYQQRTLHELLTSDLSSAGIVLGKLGARLSHVAVLLATGLPLLVATGLFGGIEMPFVLAAVAASASTAFFLGSLAILASTQTRSVRGAMNFTFTLVLTWLILPGATDVLVPRSSEFSRAAYQWLGPVNTWLSVTSPFALWIDTMRGAVPGAAALGQRIAWMIVLQVVYGAVLEALAVACLRPSFCSRLGGRVSRRRAGRSGTAAAHAGSPGSRPRPPCGDDPMFWKEVRLPRAPLFYRPLGLLITLILAGLLAWSTTALALPAFRELLSDGYGAAPAGSARAAFHAYLRIVGTGIALVYLLGVASDAAASFTAERENDTWISLITTPLTGTELFRAKMLGAVWNIRYTAVVVAGLWALGVLVDSVHPLGMLAVLAELAAFTAFTAALGTWISLRSRQTMQALARVMASLLVLSAGSPLLMTLVLGRRPMVLVACGPVLLAASLASPADIRGEPVAGSLGPGPNAALETLWSGHGPEMALTCVASVVGAAFAAWLLIRHAYRGFDTYVDRPVITGPGAGHPRLSSPWSLLVATTITGRYHQPQIDCRTSLQPDRAPSCPSRSEGPDPRERASGDCRPGRRDRASLRVADRLRAGP
jgi:ABC-type transport system involved in multi-copper enzyme maturation permease subunit